MIRNAQEAAKLTLEARDEGPTPFDEMRTQQDIDSMLKHVHKAASDGAASCTVTTSYEANDCEVQNAFIRGLKKLGFGAVPETFLTNGSRRLRLSIMWPPSP